MSDNAAAQETLHSEAVPDAAQFFDQRTAWRASMAADEHLRGQALDLQVAADEHRYTYCWEWLGVPVIRLPDDIVVLQELIWAYRPQRIIETGVARGGSVVLDASLMRLCGEEPAVLGIDISIFAHTRTAIDGHPMAHGITLLEDDST